MEERKGDGGGNGGRALTMRESGWCVTLVVVMNLLRHISCRDRVPPSGVIGRTPILTGADDLVPSRPIFRG